jgi:hypothetical protein
MDPLDALFIALLLMIVMYILLEGPGGGRRGRVPVY